MCLFVCVKEFVGEMESVESSLKQMGENVAAVQQSAVPGLASWGKKELDECQMRWDLLSKEVGKKCLVLKCPPLSFKKKPLMNNQSR